MVNKKIMERRTFVKNLAALLVISGIDPTKALSNMSDNDLNSMEMILRYKGNDIRTKIINGQINIQRYYAEYKSEDKPYYIETIQTSRSWNMWVRLKFISGLIEIFTLLSECEIIIKFNKQTYVGNGFITSLSYDSDNIIELDFTGSGPVTTW
jgi:hypothetical protein